MRPPAHRGPARLSPRPPTRAGPLSLPFLLLLGLLASSSPARGDFDPATGRIQAESRALFSLTLDDRQALEDTLPLWVSRGDGSAPLDLDDLAPRFLPASEAIEGAGALRLGGIAQWITLDLAPLAPELAGRRIEVRLWQRPDGRRIGGGLYWEDPAGEPFAPLRLRPTGRRTDDGWEEWSTGPVDAELGGLLAPAVLELGDDAEIAGHADSPTVPWSEASTHGVAVDALRILDLGPAAVPALSCAGLPAEDPCGAEGLCFLGRCSDRAPLLGNPPGARRLSGVLARRMMEVALLEGGQASRQNLPEALAGLALAAGAAPFGFYRQLAFGARPLRDDHHSPPYSAHWWLQMDRAPFVGCALLGEADLLPGAPTVPLVSQARIPGLEVGDAIVRIDGRAALDWLAGLDALLGYNGDPGGREPAAALHLLGLATFLGSKLELARCAAGLDPGTGLCAGPTELHTLSLAEASGGVWTDGESGGFQGYACEPRIERRLGTPRHDPGGGPDQAFVGDDGGVRYLRFDDFIGSIAAFDAALADGPGRVIVDERIGNGGFSSEVDYLGSFLVRADEGLGFEDAYFADASISGAEWAGYRDCHRTGDTCGGFFVEPLPLAGHPAPARAADARVAVLTHRDVSGNDFFSHLMRVRAGPTRILGPGPTAGAFGGVVGLPRRSGEVSGGAIQVADSRLLPAGNQPQPFLTGTGVAPGELLLQRQSDLLRGVDTVLEAARAWVNQ